MPESREALEALPGVGRKTANVILNTAFGQPTIAVDTHIFRVANRTGLAPGKNVREVEDHLVKVVPQEYAHDAHHWLILHGRYTCVARKPKCPECPILELCEYREKTRSREAACGEEQADAIESRHAFFRQPVARRAAPRVRRGLAKRVPACRSSRWKRRSRT